MSASTDQLVSRLLEAIEAKLNSKQKSTWKRYDPCPACGSETLNYSITMFCDDPTEAVSRPCGCKLVGDDAKLLLKWKPSPDADVLRRCEADREIVAWCTEVIGDRGLSGYDKFGSLKDDPTALAVTLAVETLRNLARGYGISTEEET